MQSRRRRQFSREFKEEAVRLVTEGGQSLAQVGRDLDLRPNLLRRWRKELSEEALEGASAADAADELRQLRKENARLRTEREILKKAVAIFSELRR
jgi:transposase